jgi:ATP phosphoribosyltransferase
MLRIAVPNKGSLAEESIAILKEAGYRQRTDSRDLVLIDNDNNVEFYYLRPRDIAIYVGSGELEAGITGRDLLIDSAASAEERLSLNFGSSTFSFRYFRKARCNCISRSGQSPLGPAEHQSRCGEIRWCC